MRYLHLNRVPDTYMGDSVYYYKVINGCLRGIGLKPLWYYQLPDNLFPPPPAAEDIDFTSLSTSGEDPNYITIPWKVMP